MTSPGPPEPRDTAAPSRPPVGAPLPGPPTLARHAPLLARTQEIGRLRLRAQALARLRDAGPYLPTWDVAEAWPGLPPNRWKVRHGVVVDGPLKFVRSDRGDEALFDIVADPLQTAAVDRPAEAARMGKMLADWRRSQPRYDKRKRTPEDRPGRPLEQDDATRRQLEALGYVGDDAGEEGSP